MELCNDVPGEECTGGKTLTLEIAVERVQHLSLQDHLQQLGSGGAAPSGLLQLLAERIGTPLVPNAAGFEMQQESFTTSFDVQV